MTEEDLTAWLDDWYDRAAGPGETWTTESLAIDLVAAFDVTPKPTVSEEDHG